jgi:hypothetical protein
VRTSSSWTYQPRYRNRLKLERTFKAGHLDLTPYGHAEAFLTLAKDVYAVSKFRP